MVGMTAMYHKINQQGYVTRFICVFMQRVSVVGIHPCESLKIPEYSWLRHEIVYIRYYMKRILSYTIIIHYIHEKNTVQSHQSVEQQDF